MRIIFLFILLPCWASAQFFLNGSAAQGADNCYTLTPDQTTTGGSIWSPLKIDLRKSFQAIFSLHLGCKDANGADGIVFGFQPVSTSVGSPGGGLGFQGVAPSLGIEFDTYQNTVFGDPAYDHISIAANGDLNHNNPASNLAGPVQASPTNANIEDCVFHRVRVDWDADLFLLRVWFDCSLRLSYTGDIVTQIFGGDPWVYWGFTAATGALSNLQQVCFNYTTFFQALPDVRLCAGGQVQLNASGSPTYSWTPAQGLSNPNIPNPVASPEQTTTYIVEMRDPCQLPYYDTLTVFVMEDSLSIELGPDASFCEGTPFTLDASPLNNTTPPQYFWSNGATSSQLEVLNGGSYRVTVSLDANCITEDWITLERIDLPRAALGPDTTICREDAYILNAAIENATFFVWNTGQAESGLLIESPGVYSILASNECGEARDTVKIAFRQCESPVFVPNVFTPNFDGINDRFGPQGPEGLGVVQLFQVFDRWGGLIYEEKETPLGAAARGWDGTLRGKPVSPGVYVWRMEIRFANGTTLLDQGAVSLLR